MTRLEEARIVAENRTTSVISVSITEGHLAFVVVATKKIPRWDQRELMRIVSKSKVELAARNILVDEINDVVMRIQRV